MRVTRLILAAALLLGGGITAQETSRRDYQYERPVVVSGTGPQRLSVDVPLLTGAQPFTLTSSDPDPRTGLPRATYGSGAADLRLFDSTSGQEVPYLLVTAPRRPVIWLPGRVQPIAAVETDTSKTSGFEVDLDAPSRVDAMNISGLPAPFLKRVRLEGSGDRSRWTMLVDEGTLFDLPAEHLQQTTLTFSPGRFQYLRATWDDTRSGRVPLPPVVTVRPVEQEREPPVALTTPLAFERRPSEPGRSRFRVRLPAAHLPVVALTLDVGGGHLLRPVTAYEARLSGSEAVPHVLGTGTLRRVVQNDIAASALRIAIGQPSEAQLDLDVEDGDNLPLDLKGVAAEFGELPWIYFEPRGGAVVARYGNETLTSPRYDLEAMRRELQIETVADASWGEPRRRTAAENEAPPPLPTAGAAMDVQGFRYQRTIPRGDAALVRLALDAAVLAHASDAPSRFSDVRVLDGTGRQVPYLLERATEPLSIDVHLEPRTEAPKGLSRPHGTRSFYVVQLPYSELPALRLVLTTSARVFGRLVSVVAEREPDAGRRDPWAETLASLSWSHRDEGMPAPALTLSVPPVRTKQLVIVVDEGDNSALPLTSARLLLPAYRLRFFRDRDASLTLAYGRDDLEPPRYDLALLAPRLLGAPAVDVDAAGEPAAAPPAAPALVSPRLFWTVLAIAVVILLGFIVRLVKKDEQAGQAAP